MRADQRWSNEWCVQVEPACGPSWGEMERPVWYHPRITCSVALNVLNLPQNQIQTSALQHHFCVPPVSVSISSASTSRASLKGFHCEHAEFPPARTQSYEKAFLRKLDGGLMMDVVWHRNTKSSESRGSILRNKPMIRELLGVIPDPYRPALSLGPYLIQGYFLINATRFQLGIWLRVSWFISQSTGRHTWWLKAALAYSSQA